MASTNCMADNLISSLSSSIRADEEELMTHGASVPSHSETPPRTVVPSKVRELETEVAEAETRFVENPRPSTEAEVSNLRTELDTAKADFVRSGEPAASTSAADMATEYGKLAEKSRLRSAEREAVEQDISAVSDELRELGEKYATAAKSEKPGIKVQIDSLKVKAAGLNDKSKRFIQESYEAARQQKAGAVHVVDGRNAVDDLLRELDTLPVADGKKTLEETLGKSASFRDTVKNMSRGEAEDLAASISEKLGSDRSQAEKIMGLNYQGAANRLDDSLVSRMSKPDQELISKARTRALNQQDYQQMERIFDNAGAYEGVSAGADLGRVKLNSVLDAATADKSADLRKLLADKDVRAALKDERFADDAFNAVYDIDPNLATQYQKAAQDSIINEVKASPRYNTLNGKQKKFIDELYTKRQYTVEDIKTLTEIKTVLPQNKFSRLIRGTVTGLGGFAWKVATSPWKLAKGAFKVWVIANGLMFVYFAAEEGFQSIIQMTGWNTPLDQYMAFLSESGIPAMERVGEILGPFNWILDNVPFSDVIFAGAAGFRWYNENAVPAMMRDKITKGVNGGLWISDASGCTFGPGCWGSIRPESERPAYWSQHPETIAFLDGDLVRRIYDIQGNGDVGPNNLIAQGLGITDPALAVQVGLGHMVAAGNAGAKDTLTKEFTKAYDQLVKGGAKSELAEQAYNNAKNAAIVAAGGTAPAAAPAGTGTGIVPLTGLNADQAAAIAVAPTTADAVTKYSEYGGSGETNDKLAWKSIFINPDGSLNKDRLLSQYPDMTGAQMQVLFPAEAINKMVTADISSAPTIQEKAAKFNEYKANGMINDNARIQQFLTADQATEFTARQNNPSNFKISASGNQISWTDDTGYPHTENIIQNGKLLDPSTGNYDVNQKMTEAGGAELTVDTGKYAAFINAGGTDVAAFLADPNNWICTYNCSAKGTSGGKSSGGGGSSKKSGGSSYSKTTGQTGIFIDAAGLNAEVYEGTEKIGDTDVIIEVEAGVHTIVIKKAGYKSYTIPVQVYVGSIARKSVTLYVDTATQTNVQKYLAAIGGENALSPDHIVYAYAILNNDTALAASAKADANPAISGTWSFSSADVLSLISTYGGV